MKLPYWFKQLFWIKSFFSPFKTPGLEFYFGSIDKGVPIFLPRKWIKLGNKEISKPIKFGFNYCGLGYKTKWDDTDYRYEWSPRLSFVFLNNQFCITVVAPNEYEYWETWLYYEKNTDKTKSVEDRLIDTFFINPTYKNDNDKAAKYAILLLKPHINFNYLLFNHISQFE